MARSKKIEVFEALIGTEWKSWKASADRVISKSGNKLVITSNVNHENFTGVLSTEFDLSKLVAFSIGV